MVQRANEMIRKAAASQQVQSFHTTIAGEATSSSPEELARFQAAESEKTGRIVRLAGIVPE